MDLSIIVPVYNTPKAFLEKCFHSIYGLHDIDFELLIVDDGSEKAIGDYCSQYASRHAKCRYLRKENGGVSSARNRGLAEAEGNFVMFVDSDDELIPDVFYKEAWGGYDFIVYDAVKYKGEGKKQIAHNSIKRVDQATDCKALLTGMVEDGILRAIHGVLYRRKFLLKNHILFNEDTIQAEDADFNFDVLMKEPRIRYIPQNSYVYRYRVANTIERWRKSPDLMIKSGAERYQRKMAFIIEQAMPKEKLLEKRVLGLYQSAIELCCAGKLTAGRKRVVRNLMRELDVNEQNLLSPSALRKYKQISDNKWIAIWILAKVRMVYLKARGYY